MLTTNRQREVPPTSGSIEPRPRSHPIRGAAHKKPRGRERRASSYVSRLLEPSGTVQSGSGLAASTGRSKPGKGASFSCAASLHDRPPWTSFWGWSQHDLTWSSLRAVRTGPFSDCLRRPPLRFSADRRVLLLDDPWLGRTLMYQVYVPFGLWRRRGLDRGPEQQHGSDQQQCSSYACRQVAGRTTAIRAAPVWCYISCVYSMSITFECQARSSLFACTLAQ